MDTVIITGAGDEPALSVARRLCELGMRVYALAGIVPETGLSADEFVPVPCDLTSPREVLDATKKILEKEKRIAGIVVAGQFLAEDFFETISYEDIFGTIAARLTSPLCVVRAALPSLITTRGNVVVISPDTGTPSRRALNSAINSALETFAGTLFEELRDTGVKACQILLKNNDGAPDPAARFTTTPQSKIQPDIVADTVESVFRLRENNALTQIILRPQATRETPRIPVSAEPKIRALQAVQLPPKKNFPPAETPIPTPAYRRPDYAPPKTNHQENAPENDGFSDDYVDPELRYLVKQNPPQNRPNAQNNAPIDGKATSKNGNTFPSQQNREGGKKRRHRNRHKHRKIENGENLKNAQNFSEKQNPAETPTIAETPIFSEKPKPATTENLPEKPVPAPQKRAKKPRPQKMETPAVPTQNSSPSEPAETPKKRAPRKRKS